MFAKMYKCNLMTLSIHSVKIVIWGIKFLQQMEQPQIAPFTKGRGHLNMKENVNEESDYK